MRLMVHDESSKIGFETGMLNVENTEELLLLKKSEKIEKLPEFRLYL